MDIKEQIIQEYLASGCEYRKLQAKYGISRTTICKWVQVYQGIHNLASTDLQQKHYKNPTERKQKDKQPGGGEREAELLQKIALLEKQLAENGDPYENAIAERVNGILKTELISSYYDTIDNASNHIARCISVYNYKRRHSSLK